MGAIVVFLVGGLISLVIAIYQFINAVYAVCGYFLALQLSDTSAALIKDTAILSSKSEAYALPVLGMLFCLVSTALLWGVSRFVLGGWVVFSLLLSLAGLLFGMDGASFVIGLAFFLLMPVIFKRLTFSIVFWEDENEDWPACLFNTLSLALISAPALIALANFFFAGGAARVAHDFTVYILVPIVYISVLAANLKRNKVF